MVAGGPEQAQGLATGQPEIVKSSRAGGFGGEREVERDDRVYPRRDKDWRGTELLRSRQASQGSRPRAPELPCACSPCSSAPRSRSRRIADCRAANPTVRHVQAGFDPHSYSVGPRSPAAPARQPAATSDCCTTAFQTSQSKQIGKPVRLTHRLGIDRNQRSLHHASPTHFHEARDQQSRTLPTSLGAGDSHIVYDAAGSMDCLPNNRGASHQLILHDRRGFGGSPLPVRDARRSGHDPDRRWQVLSDRGACEDPNMSRGGHRCAHR